MKLHKIKHRNPALDTEKCYCINNRLWNKKRVQIINNGTEFLAPKYYYPVHVSRLVKDQLVKARYRASSPLTLIKQEHERRQANKKRFKPKKPHEKTKRIYHFTVLVDEDEYKVLWNFLYKDVRDPLKDRRRIATIEELKERKKRGKNE